MSNEIYNITGNDLESVKRSANTVIKSLLTKINTLESRLKNSSGDSGKVEKNTIRIVSNKEKTYLETSIDSGIFQIELGRKE